MGIRDNVDRWKRTRTVNRAFSGNFFKPNDGKETAIRILSWEHTITDADHKLGRYDATNPAEKIGTKVEEFALAYRKHFAPEMSVCGLVRRADGKLVGECEVCEEAAELERSTRKEDKASGSKYKAQVKYAMQVINLDEDDLRIQTWDAPAGVVDYIFEKMDSRRYEGEEFFGLKKGLDLLITYNSKARDRRKMYAFEFNDRSRGEGDLTDEPIKGEVEDLFLKRQYVNDTFKPLLPEEPKEGDEAEEKPVASRRRRRGEPEPEPEPEAKPTRRSRKAAAEPAPEEAKEDADEAPASAEAAQEPAPAQAPAKEEAPAAAPKKRRPAAPKEVDKTKLAPGTVVTFANEGEEVSGKITDQGADGWYWVDCGAVGVLEIEPDEILKVG